MIYETLTVEPEKHVVNERSEDLNNSISERVNRISYEKLISPRGTGRKKNDLNNLDDPNSPI